MVTRVVEQCMLVYETTANIKNTILFLALRQRNKKLEMLIPCPDTQHNKLNLTELHLLKVNVCRIHHYLSAPSNHVRVCSFHQPKVWQILTNLSKVHADHMQLYVTLYYVLFIGNVFSPFPSLLLCHISLFSCVPDTFFILIIQFVSST